MNRKLLLISTACAILGASGGVAFAQDNAAQDSRDTNVGELVITAQKREEKVHDAPVAVTAMSAETRDLLGVISIFDLTNNVPGLVYSVGLDRAFIRGVGRNTNAPGTDPGIAVYSDGVYTASTVSIGRNPLFSERTEVLRGPQGTLYGRNSIGGAMNIISSQPTDEFKGEVRASVGDHDSFSLAGKVGGPIFSWLRYEIGGATRDQKQGYFHNVSGGPDEGGVGGERFYNGTLAYNWGDRLDGFQRIESYSYDRSNRRGATTNQFYTSTTPYGSLSVSPRFNSCAVTTGVQGCSTAVTASNPTGAQAFAFPILNPANPAYNDPYAFSTDTPDATGLHDTWSTYNNTTYHLNGADLKYIGGYNQYTYDSFGDYDGTARGAYTFTPQPTTIFGTNYAPAVTIYPGITEYREDKHWSSHELNLASTYDSPLQWIGGIYMYKEKFTNLARGFSPGQAQLASVAGNSHRDYYNILSVNEGKARAAFAQIDWAFAPQWKFTFGLRHNKEEKQGSESIKYYGFLPGYAHFTTNGNPATYGASNYSPIATCTPFAGQPAIGSGLDQSCRVDAATNTRYLTGEWDDLSGTAGVEFRPEEGTLIYAKYSRGYKSGGFQLGSLSVSPFLKPEKMNAYEAGYKFSPTRKLTVDAAIYYYDYRDAQDFASQYNSTLNRFDSVGINIEKSTNYGLDLELNWHPTSQFTLLGNYSYINATVDKACCFVDPFDPGATAPGAQPVGPLIPAVGTTPAQQPQSIAGAHLKGSPPNKFGITALYRFDFEKSSLNLSVTHNWRDGNYSSFFNRSIYEAPAYSSTNVRAVWNSDDKNYTVIAYVNNVFDKFGYEYVVAAANPDPLGATLSNPTFTIPRTFGLEVQRRF